MKARIQKVNDKKEIRVGSVLLAKPFWMDDNYKRSVILLLEHDTKGTAGVILNKQSTLSIHDALPELNILYPLHFGGPSEIKTVSYVHNNSSVPETISLGKKLFWGGDYDTLVEMINGKKLDVKNIRFCAGFVHWSPGQLEEELSQEKWWIEQISQKELFSIQADHLWASKLLSSGHMYGLLNDVPDPVIN